MSTTGPTGINGQDGLQGSLGWRGATGPTGLRGWGDGLTPGSAGATGDANFNVSQVSSGTSITVTAASLGTTYYITSPTITGIALPGSTAGLSSGAFWVFRNTSGFTAVVTLTNGTAVFRGATAATSLNIPNGTGITLAYSGTGVSYIVF